MMPLFLHRSKTEIEVWKRIRVAVWAYAYEIANNPIASDAEYDKLAASVDLSVSTSRPDLDDWFRKNFQPHTGQWIHHHPELHFIRRIYERFA